LVLRIPKKQCHPKKKKRAKIKIDHTTTCFFLFLPTPRRWHFGYLTTMKSSRKAAALTIVNLTTEEDTYTMRGKKMKGKKWKTTEIPWYLSLHRSQFVSAHESDDASFDQMTTTSITMVLSSHTQSTFQTRSVPLLEPG
jgi:hypothetical protein